MFKKLYLNLIITSIFGILITSCGGKKENFDIDLSNLKIPNKTNVKISKPNSSNSSETTREIVKNKLKSYKKNSEVISSVKIGKKDPFSKEGEVNKLTLVLKLKGFLNSGIKKYVFVNYQNNTGTITEESIGGVNTNLLPNGAKVIDIDTQNMKLTINFENEEYIFEL